jgi:hypothetical protein
VKSALPACHPSQLHVDVLGYLATEADGIRANFYVTHHEAFRSRHFIDSPQSRRFGPAKNLPIIAYRRTVVLLPAGGIESCDIETNRVGQGYREAGPRQRIYVRADSGIASPIRHAILGAPNQLVRIGEFLATEFSPVSENGFVYNRRSLGGAE